jgi:GNAT superfamily N-acetyltransferase
VVVAGLHELAEDPEGFIDPPEGAERIVDDHFCAVIGPERRWAGVCRLRLPQATREFAKAVAEIFDLVDGVDRVVWNVGSSARPDAVAKRLRAMGCVDPDPPLDPVAAAMILTTAPPRVDGVDVRRIETLADHLAGLEILLASAPWSAKVAADERARAEETFARRSRRGGLQWLALLDGTPVAFALADEGHAGLFLGGGATLPAARGRGCYRALVRARWDEALRRGHAGLAVQAQYGSSAPILRRLGFVEIATIHTLQSGTPST